MAGEEMITFAAEIDVTTNTEQRNLALTMLSEDERLFRDSVYEFADREVRPLVRDMDEHAKIPQELIDKLFDLGVMGIEIPESFGRGATFPRRSPSRPRGSRPIDRRTG
jgi:alkylation response protein AidB-like acyl-CoA dehydrogenase